MYAEIGLQILVSYNPPFYARKRVGAFRFLAYRKLRCSAAKKFYSQLSLLLRSNEL
jgi:hypothetical protein